MCTSYHCDVNTNALPFLNLQLISPTHICLCKKITYVKSAFSRYTVQNTRLTLACTILPSDGCVVMGY